MAYCKCRYNDCVNLIEREKCKYWTSSSTITPASGSVSALLPPDDGVTRPVSLPFVGISSVRTSGSVSRKRLVLRTVCVGHVWEIARGWRSKVTLCVSTEEGDGGGLARRGGSPGFGIGCGPLWVVTSPIWVPRLRGDGSRPKTLSALRETDDPLVIWSIDFYFFLLWCRLLWVG